MRSTFLLSSMKMIHTHVSIISGFIYMNLKVYWYTPWNLNFILYLSVLSCEHSLRDTKELIHELNKTNDLFKFVRIMRKKFQEVVAQGTTMVLPFFYMSAFMWCESSVCCRLNLALQLQNKLISPLSSLIIFLKIEINKPLPIMLVYLWPLL